MYDAAEEENILRIQAPDRESPFPEFTNVPYGR